jgi:hypothetical protein
MKYNNKYMVMYSLATVLLFFVANPHDVHSTIQKNKRTNHLSSCFSMMEIEQLSSGTLKKNRLYFEQKGWELKKIDAEYCFFNDSPNRELCSHIQWSSNQYYNSLQIDVFYSSDFNHTIVFVTDKDCFQTMLKQYDTSMKSKEVVNENILIVRFEKGGVVTDFRNYTGDGQPKYCIISYPASRINDINEYSITKLIEKSRQE